MAVSEMKSNIPEEMLEDDKSTVLTNSETHTLRGTNPGPFRGIAIGHRSSCSDSSGCENDSESESEDTLNWKRRRIPPHLKSDDAMPNSRSCEAFAQGATEFSEERKASANVGNLQKRATDKFSIWSNVLLEQGLVEDLNSVGMKKLESNNRGCEGYDYTLKMAYQGNKPIWQQSSQEIHQRFGCKRSVKERLGPLSVLKKDKRAFGVSEDDPEETVVGAIATILREQKHHLIARTVKILGKKKALEILRMTEDIEDGDGIMTADGSRRRTPGGVYLLLIRTDDLIAQQDKDIIFEEDKKLQTQARKQIIRAKRRKAAQAKANTEDEIALKPLPLLSDLIMQKAGSQQSDAPCDEGKQPMDINEVDSDRESGELDTDDDDD